eukprot:scaffold4570_cov81-Cylindrotheca_fusiformis.AAC.2
MSNVRTANKNEKRSKRCREVAASNNLHPLPTESEERQGSLEGSRLPLIVMVSGLDAARNIRQKWMIAIAITGSKLQLGGGPGWLANR